MSNYGSYLLILRNHLVSLARHAITSKTPRQLLLPSRIQECTIQLSCPELLGMSISSRLNGRSADPIDMLIRFLLFHDFHRYLRSTRRLGSLCAISSVSTPLSLLPTPTADVLVSFKMEAPFPVAFWQAVSNSLE